jgi:proline racemase
MSRVRLDAMRASWTGGRDVDVLDAVDTHTAGNPTRIVVDGLILPDGIVEVPDVRAWLRDSADHVRRRLVHEPRGGGLTCAVVPVTSTSTDHDLGAVILEPGSYPPMCGHCMIGLAAVVDEFDLVPGLRSSAGERTFTIRTPAGLVRASVRRRAGEASSISLTNVPSYLAGSWHQELGGRRVRVDLPYGGDHYATVDARELGLDLTRDSALDIVRLARELAGGLPSRNLRDPVTGDPLDVYQVMFHEPLEGRGGPASRVVVVAPPGEIDRSPCGTGSSALLALRVTSGELGADDVLETRSIIDSSFTVRPSVVVERAGRVEVTPVLTGTAHVTGFSSVVADPLDPLADGFAPL